MKELIEEEVIFLINFFLREKNQIQNLGVSKYKNNNIRVKYVKVERHLNKVRHQRAVKTRGGRTSQNIKKGH